MPRYFQGGPRHTNPSNPFGTPGGANPQAPGGPQYGQQPPAAGWQQARKPASAGPQMQPASFLEQIFSAFQPPAPAPTPQAPQTTYQGSLSGAQQFAPPFPAQSEMMFLPQFGIAPLPYGNFGQQAPGQTGMPPGIVQPLEISSGVTPPAPPAPPQQGVAGGIPGMSPMAQAGQMANAPGAGWQALIQALGAYYPQAAGLQQGGQQLQSQAGLQYGGLLQQLMQLAQLQSLGNQGLAGGLLGMA